jgi:hypothetical protein
MKIGSFFYFEETMKNAVNELKNAPNKSKYV